MSKCFKQRLPYTSPKFIILYRVGNYIRFKIDKLLYIVIEFT